MPKIKQKYTLAETLTIFAKRWSKAQDNWDMDYIKRRERQLLKWVTGKLFLEHR